MKGGEHRIRVATHDLTFDYVGPKTGDKKLWDDVSRAVSGSRRIMGPGHGVEHDVPKLRISSHDQPKVKISKGLPAVEFVSVLTEGYKIERRTDV